MKYFLIETLGNLDDPRLCILDSPPKGLGVKYYRMMKGKKISDDYPNDAKIFMSDKYMGIKLSSMIGNTNSYLIVSLEMKEVIEMHCKAEVEYLPFTLYNHKKRVHSTDYFIVNPIGAIDCLNHKASQIEYLRDRIVGIDKFVLDSKMLETAPALFRVNEDPTQYIINEELAKAFELSGFTNVILEEIKVVENK